LNPDDALEYTNTKFLTRFMFIEAKAKEIGKILTEMTLEEMDLIWNEAKKLEV
jgi:XTP/dITP diphosphohydrolase